MPTDEITIATPDDGHVHFRDAEGTPFVVEHTAQQFGRAIVMPNLRPPVTTVAEAGGYRQRILSVLPQEAPSTR